MREIHFYESKHYIAIKKRQVSIYEGWIYVYPDQDGISLKRVTYYNRSCPSLLSQGQSTAAGALRPTLTKVTHLTDSKSLIG